LRLANRDEMSGETRGLGGYLAEERSRLFDGASPEKREQMLAAERTREVYRAWNAVCAHTREGSHATGLHYRPETNELIVYMDSAAWTQEMTMLREIIRARMAATGVDVAGVHDVQGGLREPRLVRRRCRDGRGDERFAGFARKRPRGFIVRTQGCKDSAPA